MSDDQIFLRRRKRDLKMVGAKVPEDLADKFQKVVDNHFGGNKSAALRQAIMLLIERYRG